jgi:hypothetical protein
MATNVSSRALYFSVCTWMDDISRAFVNEALSSVFTFHRILVNTHVFEVMEHKSFTSRLYKRVKRKLR